MNILGCACYDPAVAVTKATTAALAMTALDTTNLRIAFTVPAHGMVRVRLAGSLHGAATFPSILLGVLEGATVRGRISPAQLLGNTAVATAVVKVVADYCLSGLTPGAVSWDAAYAVETLVAATGLKYGGPNNTVANDAFGAFTFEVWDPRPTPVAAAGAAGGLFIAGANAATSITGALTANLTGSVSGSVASVTADVGITQVGADKVWGSAARTLTSFGTLVADTATAVWGATTRVLTAGTNIVLAKGTGMTGLNDIAATAIVSGGAITTSAGKVSGVITTDTVTTYTGNTPQTGDAFARVGAAGAGLTALGDTRIVNLDAAVSSRSTFAGGAVASVTGSVGSVSGITAADVGAIKAKTDNLPSDPADQSLIISATDAVMARIGSGGSGLTAIGDTRLSNLDASVSSRSTFAGGAVASVTGNVGGTINGLTPAALSGLFIVSSGKVYSDAITGSVVKEIAAHAAGGGGGGGGGTTDPEELAAAVWNSPLSGFNTSGSIGARFRKWFGMK